MNILILDNYDSFTYNLVHMIEKITGKLPEVFRNDEIEIEEIKAYDVIILSPTGIPEEAGILKDVIRAYAGIKPIFGVCLGLQAITEVFGGQLENLNDVYHGVSTPMKVIQKDAATFKDIPEVFEAARYHSWIASKINFPEVLEVTSVDEDNAIMGLRHRDYPIEAVQFHPESILTPLGEQMVKNFLESVKK